MKIFTLLYTTWLRNGVHLRYLPMQRRCYQKFLRQNLQTLGELQLEKKLTERNHLGCEAKKNQNRQKPLLRKKRSQRIQAAESTVICFLELEVGLSPLWVFIISERRLWPPSGEPPHPAKMLCLRQKQSQSPTQPQSSVNGLKFFHIIYLQPCQTRSWSNILSALQCFTACGSYWDIAQPPTKQFFHEAFHHIKNIFIHFAEMSQARNTFFT